MHCVHSWAPALEGFNCGKETMVCYSQRHFRESLNFDCVRLHNWIWYFIFHLLLVNFWPVGPSSFFFLSSSGLKISIITIIPTRSFSSPPAKVVLFILLLRWVNHISYSRSNFLLLQPIILGQWPSTVVKEWHRWNLAMMLLFHYSEVGGSSTLMKKCIIFPPEKEKKKLVQFNKKATTGFHYRILLVEAFCI